MNKRWNVQTPDPHTEKAAILSEALGITDVTATLLLNRGLTNPESAERFLHYRDYLYYDAFLLPDMEKAVGRILRAVENKEKIAIYGDYDVDGVTSVSILYLYLKELGSEPIYYIPDRCLEGYGINNEAIDRFRAQNISLIITVDTGVTAIDEVAYAKSLGIETVVTDHHECQSVLPEAVAVVNPHRSDSVYPFKDLAGVGVVFKLLCALEKRISGDADQNTIARISEKYADLAAVGTIADVMPITDENRLLVGYGLKQLEKSHRLGLSCLLNEANKRGSKEKRQITSSVISFTVAPRINAAGRMGDAQRAVSLFLADNEKIAQETARELCEINLKRQEEENAIITEAREMIAKDPLSEDRKIVVLAKDHWHNGVIGIVSSRITEQMGLPSILISFDENGVGKGSGRSVKGINLVDALTYCSDLLIKFGGHELAAGLTIRRENLDAFVEKINAYVKDRILERDTTPVIDVDTELSGDDLTCDQANELLLLEPYGTSNPNPQFLIRGAKITEIREMAQKHTRMTLTKDGESVTALLFGKTRASLDFYKGDSVDVVAQLSVNDFRGVVSLQLLVRDIRLSGVDPDEYDLKRCAFHAIMKGEKFPSAWMPVRDECAAVFLYLKRRIAESPDGKVGVHQLLRALDGENAYVKTRIALELFASGELISLNASEECEEQLRPVLMPAKTKIEIEKLPLYEKLLEKAE